MPANTDRIEEMVAALTKTLQDFGAFEAQEAMSASLTFTSRLGRAVLNLAAKEDRQTVAEQIGRGLRLAAAQVEFDGAKTETVH